MHLSFLPLPLLVPWRYPSSAPSQPPFSSQTDPQYQNQYQQPLGFDDSKHSTSTNNPLNEKFERRVEWILDHFKVPGVSIAVVTGNDTFLKVNLYLSAVPSF
jgi:CubicO group peptidase (beta-lactamase class C family)